MKYLLIFFLLIIFSCKEKDDSDLLKINSSPSLIEIRYKNKWELTLKNNNSNGSYPINTSLCLDSLNKFIYLNMFTKAILKINMENGVIVDSVALPDSLLVRSTKSEIYLLNSKYLVFISYPVLNVYDLNLRQLYDFYSYIPLNDRRFLYESPRHEVKLRIRDNGEVEAVLFLRNEKKSVDLFAHSFQLP